MTASAAHPELLRCLMDDHLPAHIRLPADFLIWTRVGGDGRSLFSASHGAAELERECERPTLPTLAGISVR